jgi:8-oxo-dGTP diphosphatase
VSEPDHSNDPIATPRIAAGVLFFDAEGRVLLVRPAYKPGWDLPGGYILPGEAPSRAAAREVAEELGIKPPIGRLLVHDWAPHPTEGDKALYIFDGGLLADEHRERIERDPAEIADYAFHDTELVANLTIPRLARRISAAVNASTEGSMLYLERGESADGLGNI